MRAVDAREHRSTSCLHQLGDLPPQTWVSIADDRPFSRLRLRRLARRADLVVERELVVLPSVDAPLAVVEDTEWAVRAFWATDTASALRHSPGARTVLAALPIGVIRWLPWSWTGLLAPPRVVLARRP